MDWRREHVEVFENLIDPPDMAIREKSHPNCFLDFAPKSVS